LVVDVLASLFSPPRGESGYAYPILEAKKEHSHKYPDPAELTMKHEGSPANGWLEKDDVIDGPLIGPCKRLTTVWEKRQVLPFLGGTRAQK
jgi:hypothetical protein